MQLSLFSNFISDPVQLESNGNAICLRYCDNIDCLLETFKYYFALNVNVRDKLYQSDAIVIKINLTSGEPPSKGRTTNPIVLEQLILALQFIGVPYDKIAVADSSVIGVNTLDAARISGITEICDKYKVVFYDLNEGPFENVYINGNPLITPIPIHHLFIGDHLFRINLAKIKTTYGSQIGFCIKNLKGVIPSQTKLDFHLKGVQDCLVDLRSAVTCDLSILEGFPGSELGNPKDCNLIGMSEDDISLDCIVSELIGISCTEVPHLSKLMQRMNRSVAPLLSGHALFTSLYNMVPKFKYAAHGIDDMCAEFAIEIIDGRPCTSCVESFYKALKRLFCSNKILYEYVYVMGLWHTASKWVDYKDSKYVFVGTCALQSFPGQQLINVHHLNLPVDSVVLHGCPPTIDDMIKELSRVYDNRSGIVASADAETTASIGRGNVIPFASRHSQYIFDWVQVLPLPNYFTASAIKNVISVLPKEEVVFNDLGLEVAVQCEMVNASICHQMNWDFLRRRIRDAALIDPSYWAFDRLRKIEKKDIDELLNGYPKLERHLSEQRASMLRQIGKFSLDKFNYFQELLCRTDNSIGGEKGLLSILRSNSVFSADPEQKKAQVFIHSLLRSGLWVCNDIDNIRPAVDYHIMRLYIRRGNISPSNQQGIKYMWDNVTRRAPTTNAFRSIIAEAMLEIGQYSNESIININGAEWWVGRSICSSKHPDCHLKRPSSEWLKVSFKQCPYISNCFSHTVDSSLLTVLEPRERSTYY